MAIKNYKNYITWKDKKGNFNTQCNRASLEDGVSLTIPPFDLSKVALARERESSMQNLRIRKLTPLECLRLMGFTDTDYENLVKAGLTDSQIWHCAGDSIVSTCLVNIIGQMLPISENTLKEITENYVKTLKGDYNIENY